jgi:hypothetical protein
MFNRILYLFAYHVKDRNYFAIKCTIWTVKTVSDGPGGGGVMQYAVCSMQYAVCLENGHSLKIHVGSACSLTVSNFKTCTTRH